MTDKQIKRLAAQRLGSNGGDCISLMVYFFSAATLFIMAEFTTYYFLSLFNLGWIFDVRLVLQNRTVMIFCITKTSVEILLLTPILILIRRLFVDISRQGDITKTRRYIFAHSADYYKRAVFSSLVQAFIKFAAAVPGIIALYGVYYWGKICNFDKLTSWGLFFFMLCLGFSVIWIGVAGHYYISLSLTPYIMALNPKTNVFDACDLSVRLMEGKHIRYLKFMASFLKFIPTFVFVYPIFVIYPYFKVCYTLLMDEFLGEYNNDKMPGMIKRWQKYQ